MTDLSKTAEDLASFSGSHPAALLGLLLVSASLAVALVVTVFHAAKERTRRRPEAEFGRFAYLALHLILGLAGLIGFAIFLSIAMEIGRPSEATRIDLALARALHGATSPMTTDALRGVTFLGEAWSQVTIGVLVAVGLLRARLKLWTLGWVVALAGGGILNEILKLLYARPRPVFAHPILTASGFSFPSGHSMGTFILGGMAAYFGVLHTQGRGRHVGIVALALGWAVTMGFSRIYLGVHYLTDVLGGFAAGACWLSVCISGMEIARRWPRHAQGAA